MKKFMLIFLSIAMLFSLVACSSSTANNTSTDDTSVETTEPEIVTYALGDTVSTDLVEFTLDTAKFTISVEGTCDDGRYSTYYLPVEFDPNDFDENYTAPTGTTYVAFSCSVTNIGRTECKYPVSVSTITHDDIVYSGGWFIAGAHAYHQEFPYIDIFGEYIIDYPYVWFNDAPSHEHEIKLYTGEGQSVRCIEDIPVNIENLEDDFSITFTLKASPSYEGETEFTYAVTAEDRNAILESTGYIEGNNAILKGIKAMENAE